MADIQCLKKKVEKYVITSNGGVNSNTSRKSWWVLRNIEHIYDQIMECTPSDKSMRWVERIYLIMNDLSSRPICKVCNTNEVTFGTYAKGYRKSCSQECNNKSQDRANKIKSSFAKKDKGEHANKIREGFIKKYGVENYSTTEEFKEKYTKAMNEKYGVDNYFEQDMTQHYIDSLGVSNPQQLKSINKKTRETVKKKYKNLQGAVPKEKYLETMNERYGTDHFFASEEGKMSHENLKQRYGWKDEDIAKLSKLKNSMSFEWALKKANDDVSLANEILLDRYSKTVVKIGKASKESLKIFIPLYKFLRKRGIGKESIYFGISGSREYFIKSKIFYLYDFTVIHNNKKYIIEFNGVKFHAKTIDDKTFKHPFDDITAQESFMSDQEKISIAEDKGFKVLTLWSDESIENNIEKCKEFIQL